MTLASRLRLALGVVEFVGCLASDAVQLIVNRLKLPTPVCTVEEGPMIEAVVCNCVKLAQFQMF